MAFWKKLLSKNRKYRKKRRSRAEIWAFKVADLIFPKDSESFVRSQKFLLELELQTFSRFRPFNIVYQLQPRKFCLFRARTQTCYIPLERAWNLVSNELSTSLFGQGVVTWQPDEWKRMMSWNLILALENSLDVVRTSGYAHSTRRISQNILGFDHFLAPMCIEGSKNA